MSWFIICPTELHLEPHYLSDAMGRLCTVSDRQLSNVLQAPQRSLSYSSQLSTEVWNVLHVCQNSMAIASTKWFFFLQKHVHIDEDIMFQVLPNFRQKFTSAKYSTTHILGAIGYVLIGFLLLIGYPALVVANRGEELCRFAHVDMRGLS